METVLRAVWTNWHLLPKSDLLIPTHRALVSLALNPFRCRCNACLTRKLNSAPGSGAVVIEQVVGGGVGGGVHVAQENGGVCGVL